MKAQGHDQESMEATDELALSPPPPQAPANPNKKRKKQRSQGYVLRQLNEGGPATTPTKYHPEYVMAQAVRPKDMPAGGDSMQQSTQAQSSTWQAPNNWSAGKWAENAWQPRERPTGGQWRAGPKQRTGQQPPVEQSYAWRPRAAAHAGVADSSENYGSGDVILRSAQAADPRNDPKYTSAAPAVLTEQASMPKATSSIGGPPPKATSSTRPANVSPEAWHHMSNKTKEDVKMEVEVEPKTAPKPKAGAILKARQPASSDFRFTDEYRKAYEGVTGKWCPPPAPDTLTEENYPGITALLAPPPWMPNPPSENQAYLAQMTGHNVGAVHAANREAIVKRGANFTATEVPKQLASQVFSSGMPKAVSKPIAPKPKAGAILKPRQPTVWEELLGPDDDEHMGDPRSST